MFSSNVITSTEFALLLGGVQSFFNARPTSKTTAAAPPQISHTQTPTDHQPNVPQQQQQSSTQPYYPVFDSPPECGSPTTPAASDVISGVTTDQQQQDKPLPWNAPLQALVASRWNQKVISSSDYDSSLPVRSNTGDSMTSTFAPTVLSTTPAATGTSKTKKSTTKKSTTKEYKPPQLCTNATEVFANIAWANLGSDSKPSKNNQSVAPTPSSEPTLSPQPALDFIRQRSDDAFPTQDMLCVEHNNNNNNQPWSKSLAAPREVLSRYLRCPGQGYDKSNPYEPSELISGPDDSNFAQVAIERLRPLQDETNRTFLTDEQKLALIECGRSIANRGSWDPRHHNRHQSSSNRQQSSNNNHTNYNNNGGGANDKSIRGRVARTKICYSRDFLMSFQYITVPPDCIERIRWTLQNLTVDRPHKAAPGMAGHRPSYQGPSSPPGFEDYGGEQEIYSPEPRHRHTRGGGESSVPRFPTPPLAQAPPPPGLHAPPPGLCAVGPYVQAPPPLTPHVQRSIASASGGLGYAFH
ncbi:hypothetical protein BGX29_005438 [Mortierella sp. GBA35]|nr:hypothetical protein BGX29_005438 [Mortierella sp. GBA35]